MTTFISNIRSVSKYESKLLIRSWFFKIFTILAIFILSLFNMVMLVFEDGGGFWGIKAIASNIPYATLLLLNTGQAIVAIFLASDFLKRDKKLDTSEVFYVRPLSNAEYLIGKIWGNLRVFFILNLIIMALTVMFTFMSPVSIDWMAYLTYFLLISIPTLVFIIGLSVFLMLVLKNQAITFILLLGYIGLTIFYISNKFYYLFDYMAYYLPLIKSSIVGFTSMEAIMTHRSIYFFIGLGLIFTTISMFRRLPGSSRSKLPWLFLALCSFAIGGVSGFRHVGSILDEGKARMMYTEVNNRYVQTPKMVIDWYNIFVEQHPDSFTAEAEMSGIALQASAVYTFCLNPGLQVLEVKTGDKQLDFQRDEQIILVDFGEEADWGDTLTLKIRYSGRIDNRFCYLDIPEELLQKNNSQFLFNVDKQYGFQTSDYLLCTPETYWYPRPGTTYSTRSSDWQQPFFSRFTLNVKPIQGLIPLSQGTGTDDGSGIFLFNPEYPVQAVSLVIGKYQQKDIVSDSITYNIWHIAGHDYFSASFDSIQDTIPTLIRNVKESLERRYKLDYPFRRFSLIEVPAQFYSFPRTWSQAQETVQPEMVLFPEKGWIFNQLDVEKRVVDHVRWAKWGGQEINQVESQMRTFNDIVWMFTQSDGNQNISSAGRGQRNITTEANPYFLFPQLYNFRYNIFSADWPVANRVIELYLQDREDNNGREREINGISNNEKASLLMNKHPFKDLLPDVEYRDLVNNMISLQAGKLFADAEINMGIHPFRDSVYSELKRNTFRNIRFEDLLDHLGTISHTDILSALSLWNEPVPLPLYDIRPPEVMKVVNKGQESFILKMQISNHSDIDGIVQLNIQAGRQGQAFDPRSARKIMIPARQGKQLVSVWEDEPRDVTVNTMISGNLPSTIHQPVRNIVQERSRTPEKEGDFLFTDLSGHTWGEVIVDNEDSLLFSLSEPVVVGLLPKWLDKVGDTSFKYSGYSFWRPPLQWTPTTNTAFYGKYIRSAYVIRSGNGSQTATWRVPVPSAGHYDVYYYVYRNDEARNNSDAEYNFRILHDQETEEAYINMKSASDGWEPLGAYYFNADTISIILSNKCKLRGVIADAVKIVKR